VHAEREHQAHVLTREIVHRVAHRHGRRLVADAPPRAGGIARFTIIRPASAIQPAMARVMSTMKTVVHE
jgi:hypothetical protein